MPYFQIAKKINKDQLQNIKNKSFEIINEDNLNNIDTINLERIIPLTKIEKLVDLSCLYNKRKQDYFLNYIDQNSFRKEVYEFVNTMLVSVFNGILGTSKVYLSSLILKNVYLFVPFVRYYLDTNIFVFSFFYINELENNDIYFNIIEHLVIEDNSSKSEIIEKIRLCFKEVRLSTFYSSEETYKYLDSLDRKEGYSTYERYNTNYILELFLKKILILI